MLLSFCRQKDTKMVSNDIEVISEIEETLKVQLSRVEEIEFTFIPCYVTDKKKRVISLSLSNSGPNKKSTGFSLLKSLSKLQILYLHATNLKDYSFLKDLKNIQVIDLSDNNLKECSFLKNLNQLTVLDLCNNQIKDISFLKNLKQLYFLDLSNNNLRNISVLQELYKLREINLKKNQIKEISVFRKFISLNRLSLENNRITKLPDWITELPPETIYDRYDSNPDGKGIHVFNNPLTNPPPEIIDQGREAMRAYFRSFKKENGVRLHEAKVLLVGEGMAGKTSLLKRLQGLNFDKKESQTHGINVLSLLGRDLPGFVKPAEDSRLHIWDFGGQEIMHASHRFFMSNRSLYILVLDSRTDSKKFHWLRHIEKYGGKSPLIVAMNKIDINPSYNIEQKSINASFPWIENRFFRISCKSKEGLPEIIRSIAVSVPATPLYGMEISKSWLEIRTELEAATEAKN
ncbi:MAG: hypothetical protein D3925_06075 [Candidatus Electrothrix sp. AR5]|nr:hypothetical protein [Candidatus Electrothrix sp. AR5]